MHGSGHQIKYITLIGGNSEFVREVGVPLVGGLEEHFPSLGISQNQGDLDQSLAVGRGIRNDAVAIAGLVGIILFVGSRIAGKIIDDLYTIKIQPKVKSILEGAEKNLTSANARKKKMYWFGIWYTEQRVLVLVTVVGDSYAGILNQNDLIAATHANAVSWIENNGRQKSVHLYLLEDGRSNVAPLLFDTLMEARGCVDNRFPHKMVQKLKRSI